MSVVVVGERQFARAVARLVPGASILDGDTEPDLREPATAVPLLRVRLEAGATPAAVVAEGHPGFSVLAGLAGFPAQRCVIVGSESPFPRGTLRYLVEASGMTYLPDLDGLAALLSGRGAAAAPPERLRARANGLSRDGTGAGSASAKVFGDAGIPSNHGAPFGAEPGPPPETFSWAAIAPVQVPPAPAGQALDPDQGSRAPAIVVEAGGRLEAATGSGERADEPGLPAYQPADPLRPLRPRRP